MKKYLIKGLLALFGGTIIVGCADHDVDYVPIAQQKTQAYEAIFKEMIGGDVDPNQDWGFTGTPISALDEDKNIIVHSNARSYTRDVNSGDWGVADKYNLEFSKSKMDEILSALPERVDAANKLNDYELVSNGPVEFGIVYAVTNAADKVGYYYYDPAVGINSRTEKEFVPNIQNTETGNWDPNYNDYYFRYGHTDGNWVSPITNPDGQDAWTCTKVWNEFGFSKVKSKMITINIPVGWRMGFYVINGDNKMYSNKSLTNENNHYYSAIVPLTDGTYAVGLEDWWWPAMSYSDFDCNDIVMAIIPTEHKPTIINLNPSESSESTQHVKQRRLLAQGRVFCEDLGTAGLKDLDFNDIVFDARIWGYREYDAVVKPDGTTRKEHETTWSYKADICMLAAGGTIPAKVLVPAESEFDDYVHTLFNPNIGMTTLVNTLDDQHNYLSTTWDNYYTNPGAKIYENLDITDVILALYAKDSNHKVKVKDIPISVLWQSADDATKLGSTMQDVGLLQANLGEVPHKICLPIGTRWPWERVNMQCAYKHFNDWAKNKDSYPTFWETVNPDSIYAGPGATASLSMTDPYGNPYLNNDEDLDKDYFTYGQKTTTTTTVNETVVWKNNAGEYLEHWYDNHLVYGDVFAGLDENAPDNTYTIRIYGTSNKEGGWGAKILTAYWEELGAERYDGAFDTKGYIEYRNISKAIVNKLKYDKGTNNENQQQYSCVLQGENFTASGISYSWTTVTTKTE